MRVHRGRGVLSLFSGAGGLDLGLEAGGWNILAQVEMDQDCAETLRDQACRRKHHSKVICAPIEEVDPKALRRSLKLETGELALLAGGPPCQPFTTTGKRKAIRDFRASSVFPRYLQYVKVFSPGAILIENVDGMLSAALHHRPLRERGPGCPPLKWEEMKGSFLHWLLGKLSHLGYSVTWGVTEAADYGVPQLRQRAVLIGVREDYPCFLPAPLYGRKGMPPYRTLKDTIRSVSELGPVQPLSERKKAVFRMIPPGGNWRNLPPKVQRLTMGAAFRAEGGKSGWWRRLGWNEPSPTILGMPDHSSTALVHPNLTRCLSVMECAALQTFPNWVRFSGAPRSQYQQIGNAVPPRLAEHLGRQLSDYMNGVRETRPAPPPWRRISANRRIGTHGWVYRGDSDMKYQIITKMREDHVWFIRSEERLQHG